MADVKINGRRFSHASLEAKLDGDVYRGFKSINWKQSMKPTKVMADGPMPVGRTLGEYEAEADCEMLLQNATALRKSLAAKAEDGISYGLVEFDILCYFSEGASDPVHEVKLVGCRWESEDNSTAQGPDALVEKIGLSVMWIEKDGLRLYAPPDGDVS
jgi:hypothetical protein